MPLNDIAAFMELYLKGDETITERKLMFEAHRDRLKARIAELNDMLKVVEYKCRYFETAEKLGRADFHKDIPPQDMPANIAEFLSDVDTFILTETAIQSRKSRDEPS